MAHAAPPPGGHRRGAQILGAIAVVVGLSLAVVAIVSLNRPTGSKAARTTQSGSAVAGTTATSPRTTAKASASASRTSSSTTPSKSTSAPASTASSSTSTRTSSGASTGAVAKVALVVANNTGAAGLAESAANRFEAAGWTVTQWVNFTGDILSTCAYYDPSVTGSEAAATELQKEFPTIKRVKERFDGLPSAPIVVVLTTDYSG